jgi:tetratricopeptide (TPR) repeat protein
MNEGDLTAKDAQGRTLLHYAAGTSYRAQSSDLACLGAVAYLVLAGADINAKDNNKAIPLHYASQTGFSLAAMYLMDKGAKIDAKDKNGLTPLDYALDKSQPASTERTNIAVYLQGKMLRTSIFIPVAILTYIRFAEGYVYADMGKHDSAIQSFTSAIAQCNHAIECQSTEGYAYWMRGTSYNEEKLYDEAIADFSAAIAIFPDELNLYYNRGSAYFAKGDCEAAGKDLDHYVVTFITHTDIGTIYNGDPVQAYNASQQMMSECAAKATQTPNAP